MAVKHKRSHDTLLTGLASSNSTGNKREFQHISAAAIHMRTEDLAHFPRATPATRSHHTQRRKVTYIILIITRVYPGPGVHIGCTRLPSLILRYVHTWRRCEPLRGGPCWWRPVTALCLCGCVCPQIHGSYEIQIGYQIGLAQIRNRNDFTTRGGMYSINLTERASVDVCASHLKCACWGERPTTDATPQSTYNPHTIHIQHGPRRAAACGHRNVQ